MSASGTDSATSRSGSRCMSSERRGSVGASTSTSRALGPRTTVYLEVFGADAPKALEHFARTRDRVQDAFSDRVRAGVSPHAPYSVSLELYQACGEFGLPVATHLSESASEVDYVLRGEG